MADAILTRSEPEQPKRCFACLTKKHAKEFSRDRSRRDGLQPKCKACALIYKHKRKAPSVKLTEDEKRARRRESANAYRARNIDTCRQRSKDWMANNGSEFAAYRKAWSETNQAREAETRERYRQKHAELIARTSKVYALENKVRYLMHTRRRQAQRLTATPAWADDAAMARIYAEAARRTAVEGIAYQVDHRVPLKSKFVCGMHCEANLEVIPKADNLRKGNRYWPDMP